MRVAVGTDSLASVPDLNLFAELAEMRRLAPEVPARSFLEAPRSTAPARLASRPTSAPSKLESATRLIAVELDGPVSSVEEDLVSGIDAISGSLGVRVMSAVLTEHGRLTAVLVKHARDAFVSDDLIVDAMEVAELLCAARFRPSGCGV